MKNVKIFIFLCFLILISSFLYACDYDVMVESYEFGTFPRLVYVASVDTELDFSDVTIITTAVNGARHESLFNIDPRFPIEHSIDFATPGIYKVRIPFPAHLYIIFHIQVIDAEIFYRLSNPEPRDGGN